MVQKIQRGHLWILVLARLVRRVFLEPVLGRDVVYKHHGEGNDDDFGIAHLSVHYGLGVGRLGRGL